MTIDYLEQDSQLYSNQTQTQNQCEFYPFYFLSKLITLRKNSGKKSYWYADRILDDNEIILFRSF